MNRHLFGSHWGRCSVIVLLTATTWSPRTLSADDPRPTSPPSANPATSAESNERALDARIDQARALLKRDRPEQAARLLEPHLLEWAQLDPTQRIALVNELRACYRGAIQQHRLAGRSHKVDEFEEGLETLAKLRVAAARQVAPRSSSTRDSATKPNEGRNGLEPPNSPLHDSNLNGLFTDLPTPPTPLEADEPPHPLNRQPRGGEAGNRSLDPPSSTFDPASGDTKHNHVDMFKDEDKLKGGIDTGAEELAEESDSLGGGGIDLRDLVAALPELDSIDRPPADSQIQPTAGEASPRKDAADASNAPMTPIENQGVAPARKQPAAEGVSSPANQSPLIRLREADAAFEAKDYDRAGRIYAELAALNALPKSHHPHWGYCRWRAISQRIQAGPTSSREWDAIDAEIESVNRLCPEHWFGEYLRNLADEQRGRAGVPGATPRDERVRPAGAIPSPSPSVRNGSARVPLQSQTTLDWDDNANSRVREPVDSGRPGRPVGGWKLWESTNFRIIHRLEEERVRALTIRAETIRAEAFARWSNTTPTRWLPRCDMFLHPNADSLRRAAGQALDAQAPGISRVDLNGGRVVARTIHLRTDVDRWSERVLPREIAQVVISDLFPTADPPPWGREGLAALFEPSASRERLATEAAIMARRGRLWPIDRILAVADPATLTPLEWVEFRIQAATLVRHLVETRGQDALIQFLRASRTGSVESHLRELLGFEDLAALERSWVTVLGEGTDASSPRSQD
jgi:hypothetical protein